MTAHQHPEELIERATLGALDADEQSYLDRHLASCGVCSAELALRPRFARELAPQPRDEILVRRALEGAMQRIERSSRSRAWPQWLRLAAAGVLLASGVTAAAAIAVRKTSPRPAVAPSAPVERHVARPAPPVAAPEPPEAPPEAPPGEVPPRPAAARPALTAAALFERAGKLRREGHVDAAISAYRRLQETFPDARESQLSFALAGQLLLERGRPGEALGQFDRRPTVGGDVGEETLVGRATALEQLHRAGEAIAAWQALLDRYPGSVYAGRARARLGQLGERR
jgi:tetratricopeptide (TPR) repeat protein